MEVSGSNYFSQINTSPSIIQSPNYFTGDGITSAAISTGGTITAANLFDTQYLEMRDNYNQARNGYTLAEEARNAAIDNKISNIVSYLENSREDKAMECYNQLLAEMSNQTRYHGLKKEDDDTQLRAMARTLIENKSGKNLEEIIRENTKDQSDVESQKIRTWGNCDSVTQEELLHSMCDIEQSAGHSNIITDLGNLLISPFVVVGNYLFNGGKKIS